MISLADLLSDLGVDAKDHTESPHVTPGWLGIICPWCGQGTGNYGLGVNQRTLATVCWKCGPRSLTASLAAASGRPFREIAEALGGVRVEKRAERPPGKLELPAGLGPLLKPHRRYLKGRGFDPDEMAALWGLQGIGMAPKLKWRLFIPITLKGRVASWTTRAITDRTKYRYWAAAPAQEAIPAKTLLGGEDQVVGNAVIVVEGFFDMARVGPGAVWTMGTGFTPAQVYRLSRYWRRTICFDNDPAAKRRARALASALAAFRGETQVAELDADDPGSADKREIKLLRKVALR